MLPKRKPNRRPVPTPEQRHREAVERDVRHLLGPYPSTHRRDQIAYLLNAALLRGNYLLALTYSTQLANLDPPTNDLPPDLDGWDPSANQTP